MLASFSAELLKFSKRPATWVLLLIFALSVGVFGYLFTYIFVVSAPEGAAALPQQARDQFLNFLLPESFLSNTLSNGFAGFGGALVLILGALSVGSEYGWGTFKATLTQKPGRLGIFFGKLTALAVILAFFTVAILGVGAASSLIVASLENASTNWPSVGEILKAAGAGWLILTVFAALGLFLATLFRGTALAIGLGIVYLLVLENIFLGLAPQSETVEDIGKALPAKNSLDLANSFGEVPAGFGGPTGQAVDPGQAALVIAAYALGFLVISLLLFRRRDVS